MPRVYMQVYYASTLAHKMRDASVTTTDFHTSDDVQSVLLYRSAILLEFMLRNGDSIIHQHALKALLLDRQTISLFIIDRVAGENTFGSVRVCACVCPFVCGHSPA